MTWFDHALVVTLVVVLPIHGTWTYRRLLQGLAEGRPGVRVREYWSTIIIEWLLVAAVAALWLETGRPVVGLGLALPAGLRTVIGGALTALGLGLLGYQWVAIRRLDEAGRDRLRGQLAGAAGFLPADEREYGLFRLLAITAGICEEILYRGFLIWYAGTWISPWPAVLVTSLSFGLGHWYQGPSGMLRTGIVGLIAGSLYLATGSLLWPIVLHAAVDLQGGAVGRLIGSAPPPIANSPRSTDRSG